MKYELLPYEGQGVTFPAGFLASGISCGLKESGRPDIALVYSESDAVASAVFTVNKFAAAPIKIAKKTIDQGANVKAVLINSGNANASTGAKGLSNACEMVELASSALQIKPEEVLIASTGIIGRQLDMEKVSKGIQDAARNLSFYGGPAAAEAIMTTDLVQKEYAVEINSGDASFKIGGMAKGSGMIAPNMATMIGVLTTDAAIEKDLLDDIFKKAVDNTFNMISVDNCQSTNDCVFILANSQSGVKIEGDDMVDSFKAGITKICTELAKMIAWDGEGATKLITAKVKGAASEKDAKAIAKAIVSSDLVKAACYGNDPNWGRVIAAAGSVDADMEENTSELFLQDEKLLDSGLPTRFDEKKVSKLMEAKTVTWLLRLNKGEYSATAYGCDLSYDYVKINAEYTT